MRLMHLIFFYLYSIKKKQLKPIFALTFCNVSHH